LEWIETQPTSGLDLVMTMASHKNSHVLSQREITRDDLLSNGWGGRSDDNSEGIALALALAVTSTPTAVASSISVFRGRNGMIRELLLDAVRMGVSEFPLGRFVTKI
jgi:hypothetical protein